MATCCREEIVCSCDADSVTLPLEEEAVAQLGQSKKQNMYLTVLWGNGCRERVAEVLPVSEVVLFGRGNSRRAADPEKQGLFRQRPAKMESTGPLQIPSLSRRQWLLFPQDGGVQVKNLGAQDLLHNGNVVAQCDAYEGDLLEVRGVVLFLVEPRPHMLSPLNWPTFPFGEADCFGMIGESVAAWKLRASIVSLASESGHILVLGGSGSGKELVAQALHQLSGTKPLLARNAATIPPGLVEAELFGCVAHYPNSGSPARQGMVGAADGGVLFLDEVGELPERHQANFLRVMDAGEYQMLGDTKTRRSQFRLIAATNRPATVLKHDFAARFTHHLCVPDLNERRADIPLLVASLLGRSSHEDVCPAFLARLATHNFRTNIRELARLASSLSQQELVAGPDAGLGSSVRTSPVPSGDASPRTAFAGTLTRKAVERALEEEESLSQAAEALGLSSRYALYRLMRKLGVPLRSEKAASSQRRVRQGAQSTCNDSASHSEKRSLGT